MKGVTPPFVIPGLTRNPVDYKTPYKECFIDWIPGQARNDERECDAINVVVYKPEFSCHKPKNNLRSSMPLYIFGQGCVICG